MYCYQCGKQVEEDVKFCPYCGAQLNSHDQNNGNGYNPINQNYQGSYQKPDDESSFGYALLSFFIPVVGAKNIHCVLNLVSKALLLILFFMF